MCLSSKKALVVEVKTLVSTISFLKKKTIVKSASILAPVIDKKVIKTKASFLIGQNSCLYNTAFYYSYNI